ncbi:alpha/beta hydrolase [Nonomuraea roseola]|uniref:Alpha/beta hydrolase n=1 Tax=Nonomuraea roseola TaxID=46179 RepID=A0ABV5QBT1_9ACTN
MISARTTRFRSLDGLDLIGTLTVPEHAATSPTVLVHGGGVNRDEGGFFTRLAEGLARAGSPSLRFDFRGHGESSGTQEELTISGVANDIHAAVTHVRDATGSAKANIIGASFGGGIAAYYTSRNPALVRRLTLINPLLDYKRRFVDDKPYWNDDRIDMEAGNLLEEKGSIEHSPTFKLGRALLNEVFHVEPHKALRHISVPTLIIHGTQDTFIPIESSRSAVSLMAGNATLLEIDGAQHGIAIHDDPRYSDPQTQAWQSFVIDEIAKWLTEAD